MRAILTDGTEIDCGGFKALDGGVVLTADKKRKTVIGFVPMSELRYVVPADFEPVRRGPVTDAGDAPGTSATGEDLEISGAPETRPATTGDLQRLGSLGPTYANRLVAAGYESMEALAAAEPEVVAATAAVPEGLARRWVTAARARVGDQHDGEGEVEANDDEDEKIDESDGDEHDEDEKIDESDG